MNQQRQLFAFACNPAAFMHAGWRGRLAGWGMPEALCDPLWESRRDSGDLSRFLARRFALDLALPANIDQPYRQVVLLDAEPFEIALMRLGSIFLHKDALHILDGATLRQLKQEFGEKHFYFMRHQAGALMPLHADRAELPNGSDIAPVSKDRALLLGLAALLKYLPPSADVLTRLCLKLAPFADEPRPPQGFALIRAYIDRMDLSGIDQWDMIFSTHTDENSESDDDQQN